MSHFRIKKLVESAIIPTRAEKGSAGIDVYTNESYTMQPGETHAYTTGISAEFDPLYVALIWDRSGLGSKGVHRYAGVIDSSYRGEWKIILHNTSEEPFEIKAGDRVAQCLMQEFAPLKITEVKELSDSSRGEGGFGSTGR